MTLTVQEINRKLLHILSGTLIPGGIFYIPKIWNVSDWVPTYILAIFVIVSLLVEYLRINTGILQEKFLTTFNSMLRQNEQKEWTGSTYIFISAFLCSILFHNHPYISFIALSCFILGDAIAAVVGLSIGRIKIGKKTLEGSIACFLLSFILLKFVFPLLPDLYSQWNGTLPITMALIAGLCVTLCELFPVKISKTIILNDNLSGPLITGCIILFTSKYFI